MSDFCHSDTIVLWRAPQYGPVCSRRGVWELTGTQILDRPVSQTGQTGTLTGFGLAFRGCTAYSALLTIWRLGVRTCFTHTQLDLLKISKDVEQGKIEARWRARGRPRAPWRAKERWDEEKGKKQPLEFFQDYRRGFFHFPSWSWWEHSHSQSGQGQLIIV